MECCTYRKCSPVICYTVDGMLHMHALFLCYMLHSWWNVAHTGNVRLLYATQLMECCTYRKCSPVIYTVDGNVAHAGNVRLLYAAQLMECCTYRQCSYLICYTVNGMLHTQAMFVCYMLHSWWNVAHTGNVRLLYATQLMECCTYRQCSSVIRCTVDGMLHGNARLLYATQYGMLHLQAIFVCYMIHSWWNVAHTGNVRWNVALTSNIRLLYASVRLSYDTQLMECCTHRQCSSVICYTVDGMLHICSSVICYTAHTGNVLLLYATQLMECCTYRQRSSVICYTVDGMLHIQAHMQWNSSVICCTVDGMLHMHICRSECCNTGNVRLLYAICYIQFRLLYGMLHIQGMLVCYMEC